MLHSIDREVAQIVMGWHVGKIDDDWVTANGKISGYTLGTCFSQYPIWSPSTNWDHHELVAETLKKSGWTITSEMYFSGNHGYIHTIKLIRIFDGNILGSCTEEGRGYLETFCRAAVRAKQAEVQIDD